MASTRLGHGRRYPQMCRAPAATSRVLVFAITMPSLEPGAADETARVHHAGWRRGSRVAAHGACAAAGSGAADWHSDASSLDGPPVESSFAAVTTWVNRSDFEEEHGDDDLLDRRSQPP